MTGYGHSEHLAQAITSKVGGAVILIFIVEREQGAGVSDPGTIDHPELIHWTLLTHIIHQCINAQALFQNQLTYNSHDKHGMIHIRLLRCRRTPVLCSWILKKG